MADFPVRLARTALLAFAALLPFAPARAQQAGADLTVVVADTTTGQPIAGAMVSAGRLRAETNARGEAVLHGVPAGTVTIEARRLGFLAGSVQATMGGSVQTVSVPLAIDPVVLRRLHVTAAALPRSPLLRDFYIRKATWGSGYFLTRDDFDRDGQTRLSQAMRRIPGVNIIDSNGHPQLRFTKNVDRAVGGDCEPVVFLDGHFYGVVADLDHDFQGLLIEGVEVYDGARVPPQFNGGSSGCGVLVIWSRQTLSS
jgi:carboxypeptidase family protein